MASISSLPNGKRYHVFFIYACEDIMWVKETVRRLENNHGLICCEYERDNKPGTPLLAFSQESIRSACKCIIAMSRSAFTSHYVLFEIDLALNHSLRERRDNVVPVLVETCDIPDTLQVINYIDATDPSGIDSWWSKLLIVLNAAVHPREGLLTTSTTAAQVLYWPDRLTQKAEQQKFIGRGAFAEVYEHYDVKSKTMMALKVVKHQGTTTEKEISESLLNEVRIMSKLNHHRIIKYYGCLRMSKGLEILMEYMPNGSLKDYMSNHEQPFGEDIAAKLTMHIVEGIVYLHANKILHRDIKGSNVLLTSEMDAKLADFGISKEIQTLTSHTTGSKNMVGTFYWMSPERIKGEKYGETADIWSIGCTVVEMITMHPPWHEFELATALFKIVSGMYPTYQLPQTTSTEIKDFLLKIFRTKASERPKATELLLHPFLCGNLNHSSTTQKRAISTIRCILL